MAHDFEQKCSLKYDLEFMVPSLSGIIIPMASIKLRSPTIENTD